LVALVHSGAVLGIDGYPVEVEVNLAQGLPGMSIVVCPMPPLKKAVIVSVPPSATHNWPCQ